MLWSINKAKTETFEIYDAAADFSAQFNPTPGGVWSYGYAQNLNSVGSGFIPYTETMTGAGDDRIFWVDPLFGIIPDVQFSPSSGQLGLHLGIVVSVIRFTASCIGTYRVTANFAAGDTAYGTTTGVHILPATGTPDSSGSGLGSLPPCRMNPAFHSSCHSSCDRQPGDAAPHLRPYFFPLSDC